MGGVSPDPRACSAPVSYRSRRIRIHDCRNRSCHGVCRLRPSRRIDDFQSSRAASSTSPSYGRFGPRCRNANVVTASAIL